MSPPARLLLPRVVGGAEPPAPDSLLLAAIFREIEAERRRLADLLNDDPVQTLAHLARVLRSLAGAPGTPGAAAASAHEAGELAAVVSQHLRVIARGLRPPLLDDLGLASALNQLAAEVTDRSGIQVRADLREAGPHPRPEVDLVLFRVAQAALRNAEDHCSATRAGVRLRHRGERLTLTVCDDGIALSARERETGTGLLEMRERLRWVGGRLQVRSGPARGTLVMASVPASGEDEPRKALSTGPAATTGA